jgi:putative flippase GtrA
MSGYDALVARFVSPEVLSFLAVGGTGYVVDVAAFNLLRSTPGLAGADPSYARILAVALAMVVTYVGNRMFTWRAASGDDRRRQIVLFVVFNLIGLGLSVLTLTLSHDVLGLTSRLADNVSANVVGLALGTVFRFWSYRRFVFAPARPVTPGVTVGQRRSDRCTSSSSTAANPSTRATATPTVTRPVPAPATTSTPPATRTVATMTAIFGSSPTRKS